MRERNVNGTLQQMPRIAKSSPGVSTVEAKSCHTAKLYPSMNSTQAGTGLSVRTATDRTIVSRIIPRWRLAERNAAFNRHDNQAPEDRHGAQYDNDVADNRLRGGGENATTKPGFDFGGAWRQPSKSIPVAPGDLGQQRKPEPNK